MEAGVSTGDLRKKSWFFRCFKKKSTQTSQIINNNHEVELAHFQSSLKRRANSVALNSIRVSNETIPNTPECDVQ